MSTSTPQPRFTDKQGQYLAFIHAYALVNGRPPAEADMERFFGVTPPCPASIAWSSRSRSVDSSVDYPGNRAASKSYSTRTSYPACFLNRSNPLWEGTSRQSHHPAAVCAAVGKGRNRRQWGGE